MDRCWTLLPFGAESKHATLLFHRDSTARPAAVREWYGLYSSCRNCACCRLCRIKPLRVNAYVDASIVSDCVKGIKVEVLRRFVTNLLACDRYFVDDNDFRAWLAQTGETSSSFRADRLEFE